jgi:hypothetical protein
MQFSYRYTISLEFAIIAHMKIVLIAAITFFSVAMAHAQQKPAYILYNAKGKKVGHNKMLKIA